MNENVQSMVPPTVAYIPLKNGILIGFQPTTGENVLMITVPLPADGLSYNFSVPELDDATNTPEQNPPPALMTELLVMLLRCVPAITCCTNDAVAGAGAAFPVKSVLMSPHFGIFCLK